MVLYLSFYAKKYCERYSSLKIVRTARSKFEKITILQFNQKIITLQQQEMQNLDRIFNAVLMHYSITGISRDQHELFLESSYEKLARSNRASVLINMNSYVRTDANYELIRTYSNSIPYSIQRQNLTNKLQNKIYYS